MNFWIIYYLKLFERIYMDKVKAIKKLTEQIEKLEDLPHYHYRGENIEFDKWKRFATLTIEKVLGNSHADEFSGIRYRPTSFSINSNGHEFIEAHNRGRIKAKAKIESFIEEIEEFWEEEKNIQDIQEKNIPKIDKSKIFIVHGHDDGLVAKVQLFLKKIGLEGIVLHEQANLGKVILEKLEHYTNVGFAIVLYTPCDLGKAKADGELKARARQNVVFEHGYLMGKLGRENVAFIVDGKIETPGDISGAVYSSTSNHWQFDIVKELKAVGYEVSADNLF